MTLLFFACVGSIPDGASTGDETTVAGHYELGWPIGSCQDDVSGEEGFTPGTTIPDYEMVAQTGETVRLYDFCNQVVYIELGYFT